MANQKQYKRIYDPGDYQITGEGSNGLNISKDGNTYLFTGNNEEYLNALRDGNIQTPNGQLETNDPNNAASFIGMYRQGGSNITLGNPNQQSLNINNTTDQNKDQNIIIPAPSIIPSALPDIEPKPPLPPPPPPTTTPEEGTQELQFEELPDEEGFQLFYNSGVPENSDLKAPLTLIEETKLLAEISVQKYSVPTGGTEVKETNITILKGNNLSDEAKSIFATFYNNTAVNSAIKMNPTNYGVINSSVPIFKYKGIAHGMIVAITRTPQNLFCAAGISVAFIAANNGDKTAGGFPKSNSSQAMISKQWTSPKYTLQPGTDYTSNGLTDIGLAKWKAIGGFKGACFCVSEPDGTGHTGMVLGVDIDKAGYFYTLEYNTSAPGGNERTGGLLAFRKRKIGAKWGFTVTSITFGDTSLWKGGLWAPNGISNDASYLAIGSWIKNKNSFK